MKTMYVFNSTRFRIAVGVAVQDYGLDAVASSCGVVPQAVINWREGRNSPHVSNFAAFCTLIEEHPARFYQVRLK